MAAIIQDVVNANLVLIGIGLLNTPNEVEKFKNSAGADVQAEFGLATIIPSGVTEPSRKLTLNRDRIVLNLSQSRSSIAREYPSTEDPIKDFTRLSEVVQCAISSTELEAQSLVAYGYNIELVFDQDTGEPATHYLGNRLFGADFPSKETWELTGGTGQITFKDNARQWTISIGPRSNDEQSTRVAVGLNLHLNKQTLPDEAEIKATLEEIWNEAKDFMNRLDGHR